MMAVRLCFIVGLPLASEILHSCTRGTLTALYGGVKPIHQSRLRLRKPRVSGTGLAGIGSFAVDCTTIQGGFLMFLRLTILVLMLVPAGYRPTAEAQEAKTPARKKPGGDGHEADPLPEGAIIRLGTLRFWDTGNATA